VAIESRRVRERSHVGSGCFDLGRYAGEDFMRVLHERRYRGANVFKILAQCCDCLADAEEDCEQYQRLQQQRQSGDSGEDKLCGLRIEMAH
jgi:hypothetical protein